MIKIIIGKRGTGKTKKIIGLANDSAKQNGGNVVFIDDNNKHIYDLDHKIRFIDTSEFEINNFFVAYGFICGIISGNFDVSHIYIDGILTIIEKREMNLFETFLNEIKKVAEKFNIKFTFTITSNSEEIPEFLKEYIVS